MSADRMSWRAVQRPLPAFPINVRTVVVKHTLVALVQDRPGVLNRAMSVFRRRGLNIESLTVTRTADEGISRMTWVVDAADVTSVVAQLEKLIDVLEVHEMRSHGSPPRAQQSRSNAPTSSFALTQADGIA